MISICIPVYNFKVDELVRKLDFQANLLEVPTEIILIDDCSEKMYQEYNEKTCNQVKYIQLEKNIGRAAIRNLFLKYASFNHLIFLDCDSVIISDDFLVQYLNAIQKHPEGVICGGREYDKKSPSRNQRLRWKYGIRRESNPLNIRVKNPNVSFMTNNFAISRSMFEKIQFDERLRGYGHEDTLFGYELKKKGVNIIHIDNAILNGHLETNTEFLQNTERALANLAFILQLTNYDKELIEDVSVLRVFYKILKLRKMVSFLFRIKKPFIKFLLIKGYVSLFLFDFYKLGTFSQKFQSRV